MHCLLIAIKQEYFAIALTVLSCAMERIPFWRLEPAKVIPLSCSICMAKIKPAPAFNQLSQYITSSPGRRGYCYADLDVMYASGGRNHCTYSLRLSTEGWPG